MWYQNILVSPNIHISLLPPLARLTVKQIHFSATTQTRRMNGSPSISNTMDYVRIESDSCESHGLQSLNQSECNALLTDLNELYNAFVDPAPSTFKFENVIKIEEKSCAELGHEDLTNAECQQFGSFTATAVVKTFS